MFFGRTSVVAGLVLALSAAAARADVIYSNLASGSTNYGNLTVYGSNVGGGYVAEAAAFTPTANAVLQETQVSVLGYAPGSAPGDTDSNFDEILYSGDGGTPAVMVATLASDLAAPAGGGNSVVTVDGLSVPLTQGTQYWLALAPFDAGTFVSWGDNGQSSPPSAYTTSGSPPSDWQDAFPAPTQFEVDGAAVPEPSSVLLLGGGMLALIGWGRRR